MRYFWLSFSAAFLVISLMFLFLMTTLHPQPAGSLAPVAASAEEEYVPDVKDAVTVLIFGANSADSTAGTYLLARFDPAAGGVSVTALPPQTVISESARQETLEEAYRYGGAIYTRDALSKYLGVPIHRYARVSVPRFIEAADAVGVVEFDLKQDVSITDDNVNFTLNAGLQLLDGRKAAGVVRYRGFEGGELERCDVISRLACAVINQRIDVASSTLADKVFSLVINLIDTDISYPDYEQRKIPAVQMAKAGGEIARPVNLEGKFSDDGARFFLYDTSLARVARAFS